MSKVEFVLFAGAAGSALIHALLPHHWLPMVLLARQEQWSKGTLLRYLSIMGVLLMVSTGLLGWLLGLQVVQDFWLIHEIEHIGPVLLLGFGLVYAFWATRSHGNHPHIGHHHHGPEIVENWQGTDTLKKTSGLGLAIIMGINPCPVAIPFIMSSDSSQISVLIGLSFGLITAATIFTLAFFTAQQVLRFRPAYLSKYGEILTGLFISAVGLVFLIVH